MAIKLTKIVRVEVLVGEAHVAPPGGVAWRFEDNSKREPVLHEDSEFLCLASNHDDASGALVPWDLWQRVVEVLKTSRESPRSGPTVFDLSEIEDLL
jgi:hypothetical protein